MSKESFEDWLIDNEWELCSEYLEEKGMQEDFNRWAEEKHRESVMTLAYDER
jgi:hypothetical protein